MEINNIKDQIEKTISLNFDKKIPTFMMYVSAYFENSAGIMAQYKLANDLQAKGYNVFGILWDEWNQLNINFVNTVSFKIYHNICIIPKDFAIEMCQKYNCIAIYTDHDNGNLLNAKVVSRWLGNKPGNLTPYQFDSNNEKIFTYYKCFGKNIYNIQGILTIFQDINNLSKYFFYDKTIEKTLITSYAGRNKFNADLVPKIDVKLTRTYPSDKIQLGNILRKTKILYVFDQLTALIYEAFLCGCKVIIIDKDNIFSKDDYLSIEHGSKGLYFIDDDINIINNDNIYPIDIAKYAYDSICNINNLYPKQLDQFLNIMIQDFLNK